MSPEEAYSIRLAGETSIGNGVVYYTERYISDGKYCSDIYCFDGINRVRITHEGNARSPQFQDGTLYYVRFTEDSETLMVLSGLSEPVALARFRKIRKYLPIEGKMLVIAEEGAEKSEPFYARDLKYRFNGAGLLRKRPSLYIVDGSGKCSMIYGGNFDVEDVKYGGHRIIIQTTENEDSIGLSDLYEISEEGKKIGRITKEPMRINSYAVSGSGRIALSGHDGYTPWELNRIIFPESGESVMAGNDSSDSVLSDLFWSFPLRMKFVGDVLYTIGQVNGSSYLYEISGLNAQKISEESGKILNFDVYDNGPSRDIAYIISTSEKPCILHYRNTLDINPNIRGKAPEAFRMDGGEVFFLLRSKNSPTVVSIHGGPQTAYGQNYSIEFQFLLNNGFNVLYTNPPGSTGYGAEYAKKCAGDWGNLDFEFIQKAIRMVNDKYGLVESFAVTGGSYGGYMTNWIVSHSDIFKCAISERSISNLLSMVGTSDIGFWFNTIQLNVSDPFSEEGIRKLMEYSPISFAKRVKTPVLLITGEEDYRCPIEQAEQFFVALKMNGVEAELIRYQGDNHEHARAGVPKNMVDRLKRKKEWFEKYLKD